MMGANVEIFIVGPPGKPRAVPPSAVASRGDTLAFANLTRDAVVVRFDDPQQFRPPISGPIPPGDSAHVHVLEEPPRFGTFRYHVEVGPTTLPVEHGQLAVPGTEVEAHSSPEVIIRR